MCLLELVDSIPSDVDGLGDERRILLRKLEEVLYLLLSVGSFLGSLAKVEVVALALGRKRGKSLYWIGAPASIIPTCADGFPCFAMAV